MKGGCGRWGEGQGEAEGTLRSMVKVLARSCVVGLPTTPLNSRPAINYGPVNCIAVFRLVVIILFFVETESTNKGN